MATDTSMPITGASTQSLHGDVYDPHSSRFLALVPVLVLVLVLLLLLLLLLAQVASLGSRGSRGPIGPPPADAWGEGTQY